MSNQKLILAFALILLVISMPFTFIHLKANPNDASITFIQHLVAAMANFLGPWGVVLVRLVDFPNAGLQSFSWVLAGSLTLLGIFLVGIPIYLNTQIKKRSVQYLFLVFWFFFLIVWFGVGLR